MRVCGFCRGWLMMVFDHVGGNVHWKCGTCGRRENSNAA